MQAADDGGQDKSQRDERQVTTARSTGPPICSRLRLRALHPSTTRTRGSSRKRDTSWSVPTSTATTSRAPRLNRTSVKPPVDAPTSSTRRPSICSSVHLARAPPSLWPPLEARSGPSMPAETVIARSPASRLALVVTTPSTSTRPAVIRAAARRRESASPRMTISVSSRRRGPVIAAPSRYSSPS